jgi:hypothetical protein
VLLAGELVGESFAAFRSCGRGERECVVLWTGPLDRPGLVDRLVHPEHLAGLEGYDLAVPWLKRFWRELHDEQRSVRVQVHTHPREAFHSHIDDSYPMVQTYGFLSLVIPNFGLREPTLNGAALYELGHNGHWRELDPLERLQVAA